MQFRDKETFSFIATRKVKWDGSVKIICLECNVNKL